MPPRSEDPWELLCRRADEALSHQPDGFRALMQVREGSLHPGWGSVDLHELLRSVEGKPTKYVVRTVRWRRDLDTALFRDAPQLPLDLGPTIEESITDLATRTGRSMEKVLLELRLPLVPREPLYGMDGSTVQVRLGEDYCGCTLWWWEEAPEEWKDLGNLVEQIRRCTE